MRARSKAHFPPDYPTHQQPLSSIEHNTIPYASAKRLTSPPGRKAQAEGRTRETLQRSTNAFEVPATDPQRIEQLWASVRDKKSMAAPSRIPRSGRGAPQVGGKRGKKAGRVDAHEHVTASDSLIDDEDDETSDMHSVATSKRSTTIGVYSSSFRHTILDPRGINLVKSRAVLADKHFNIVIPQDNQPYSTIPELSHANIFLDFDGARIEKINNCYRFMEMKRLSEDQFASYAKETFFLHEDWELYQDHDRRWRGERLDTFVNPPNDENWDAPPRLGGEDLVLYRWDIRPDCAYWLSIRGFNESYTNAIKDCCFIYKDWISTPYLTIEFKKNNWKPGTAATQVMTAGAMALYNRFKLRVQAGSGGSNWNEVKHYAITFEGPSFVVYVIRPNIVFGPSSPSAASVNAGADGPWRGCTMSRLAHGDCNKRYDVAIFVRWINEIHRWGITVHADSVQNDIRTFLQTQDIDVTLPEIVDHGVERGETHEAKVQQAM